jgi:hypothetical protein
MQPMRFAEFARKLPSVFDNLAKHGEDIIVEKEGHFFIILTTINYDEKLKEKLKQKRDIWADYDPEKTKQGLQQSAGALKGVDPAALKQDIKHQRQQESHGRPV